MCLAYHHMNIFQFAVYILCKMDIYNKIAQISLEHFSKLPKTGKPTNIQWTILSTIVQENMETDMLEVVALGTGTKCIGKSQMSISGDILNDSHAEIICRRSFLKYIYIEMKYCLSNIGKSAILDFHTESSKFSVKSYVNFHFFTTHVPCGDAAIFPKENMDDPGQTVGNQKRPSKDVITNDNKRIKLEHEVDVYRTGAKCLLNTKIGDPHEGGANFHVVGPIRTKPGRGDPTLSVSCSDKIAKWCYLGIQGSLLSLYLDKPIYLKSFTIAANTPYSKSALERAFEDRFDDISLGDPFRKHTPLLNQCDHAFEFEKTNEKIPCPSSILWWKGIRKIEVSVDGKKEGITKKMKNRKESRLSICKIELMRNFIEIAGMVNIENITDRLQYNEIKALCGKYQNAWKIVKNDVFKVFVSKDSNLLDFKLD